MAKKIGLDTKKAKEFLLQKGERVGLGVAASLTLLVLVLGFLGISTRPPASAHASTWSEAIGKAADELDNKIKLTFPPDTKGEGDGPKVFEKDNFVLLKPSYDWYEPTIGADTKRRNPRIVKCPSGPEDIQIDRLLASALRYQPDTRGHKYKVIDAGDQPAAQAMDGRRMVIVTASFPVNDQLDEFVNALQAGDREKLLAGPDAPRILGLDVYRTEVLPDGKQSPGDALYVWDPKKERVVVAKHLDEFFRNMVIDENNPKHLEGYLGPNMVTPLPLLATISGAPGRYPKVRIKEIEIEDEPPEMKPKNGPPPEKGFKFPGGDKKPVGKPPEGKDLPDSMTKPAEAPRELQERFNDNYNVFDPFGGFLVAPETEKDPGEPKKIKGKGKGKVKGKTKPPAPKDNVGKEDDKKRDGLPITEEASRLLIRFIDVDVEPGKTYHYHFRVRIANPNYGKSSEVSALEWSKYKELAPGEFTSTEAVSIPQESFYYAVDQLDLGKIAHPKDPLIGHKIVDGNDVLPNQNPAETTPVQIHRWINHFQSEDGGEHRIGEWVVAERLLVRRGDLIGRKKVVLEMPEWYDNNNRFGLGRFDSGKNKFRGTPVNFLPDESKAPLLVDFQAAHKSNEGATELLVLGPDGKLTVRNSRVDSDPKSAEGQVRQRHYDHWRQRIEDLRLMRQGGGGGGFPGGKKGVSPN